MKQIHISSKNLLHHLQHIGVLRVIKIIPVFLLSALIFSACMKDDYEEVEEEQCPDIVSTYPDETTGPIDITDDITVTFNKEMCINAVRGSFYVIMGTDTISGDVYTNDEITFGFRPKFNLNVQSSYLAVITTDVADCFGLTLIGGDYRWTFDTDNVAPKVMSTNPANGASNVPRNIAIEIEFDKDIECDSIRLDMFTLVEIDINENHVDTVDVFSFECSGRVITFYINNLLPGTDYKAILEPGVRDTIGYFTENEYSWEFKTGFEFDFVSGSVNLRSLVRFALFSSDFITHSGDSISITGDVGIIPGLTTDITGVDETDVDGEIIADPPLPVGIINPILIEAKNDLSAAYLTAKRAPITGSVSDDPIEPGVYNLSGNIGNHISLDGGGDADAFWIFKIDGDLDIANNIEINFSGGAHPNNVFWQVGGVATIGANASFIGNIMAKEGIELSDGASITGRLLVKNGGISLNNNTIELP